MITYMRPVWSNFCIYLFMLLFSFSIFSDRWSLKIENLNNSMNTLTPESPINRTRVPRVQFIDKETYSGWLELPLPLPGTNFHGPKPVSTTKVRLYIEM